MMSEEFMMAGDPESVRAVERWIRSDVLDALGDCIAVARRVQALDYTYWDGAARNAFNGRIMNTATGLNKAYELLGEVADLLSQTADSVGTINAAMSKSMDHVRKGGLKVEDGWIAEPNLEDYVYPGSENTRTGPGGESESARFEKMAEHYKSAEEFASKATRESESLINKYVETYGDKYDFLVFVGVKYVNDAAKEWSVRSGSRMGLTYRLTKVGGPLIQAAGAAWSLYAGTPPAKVFLSTSVGLVVGSLTYAIAAPVTVPAALAAISLATVLSTVVSKGAEAVYDMLDRNSPNNARNRLRGHIRELERGG